MKAHPTPASPPLVNVRGAFLRKTDFTAASLRHADLARADFSHAILRDADLLGADLDGTILLGADLTGARNVTVEQLARALINAQTKLPTYIDRDRLTFLEDRRQEAPSP